MNFEEVEEGAMGETTVCGKCSLEGKQNQNVILARFKERRQRLNIYSFGSVLGLPGLDEYEFLRCAVAVMMSVIIIIIQL